MTITPKACETIKSIVAEEKKDDPIRIVFAGYSCSGPAFMMAFDKKKDEDVEVKENGITLIYDRTLEESLREATIDSVDTPQGPGVVVKVKSASSCSSACAGCH
ncbi:MAG: iron-sulfur cluster assembly accessory protein [Methanobacteriota archaeon]|nr:MAG: iron-sulfur cluster assembly accessory protein [Euryarchaeota archaeon]